VAEGDRGDGVGGVGADAGQRAQAVDAAGEGAAAGGDGFGAGVQVARAGVIAEVCCSMISLSQTR
jgi:hypothetical protein